MFIGKTPAIDSVKAGHYFQGSQGRTFWNKLAEYYILNVPHGKFEDEYLVKNKYGITDIVKVPRDYGNEPSDEEYLAGLPRILKLIKGQEPHATVFVYKRVLDNIMRLGYRDNTKSKYGFNPQLDEYFCSKVFVFPMPGTPCTKAEIVASMTELKALVNKK